MKQDVVMHSTARTPATILPSLISSENVMRRQQAKVSGTESVAKWAEGKRAIDDAAEGSVPAGDCRWCRPR